MYVCFMCQTFKQKFRPYINKYKFFEVQNILLKKRRNFRIKISLINLNFLGLADSILIKEGSINNFLTPIQYTPFWYLVKFTEGCENQHVAQCQCDIHATCITHIILGLSLSILTLLALLYCTHFTVFHLYHIFHMPLLINSFFNFNF